MEKTQKKGTKKPSKGIETIPRAGQKGVHHAYQLTARTVSERKKIIR